MKNKVIGEGILKKTGEIDKKDQKHKIPAYLGMKTDTHFPAGEVP